MELCQTNLFEIELQDCWFIFIEVVILLLSYRENRLQYNEYIGWRCYAPYWLTGKSKKFIPAKFRKV